MIHIHFLQIPAQESFFQRWQRAVYVGENKILHRIFIVVFLLLSNRTYQNKAQLSISDDANLAIYFVLAKLLNVVSAFYLNAYTTTRRLE